MQIMNSGATMAALGELRKNDTTLGKELRKVASGMKVNGAGDGASEYAMSERMRVRLRSLDQDIENAQTGRSLVNVASGAIQDIVDNLRSMKAMAIDAANDHNTDADRATMEKEFDQRKEQNRRHRGNDELQRENSARRTVWCSVRNDSIHIRSSSNADA